MNDKVYIIELHYEYEGLNRIIGVFTDIDKAHESLKALITDENKNTFDELLLNEYENNDDILSLDIKEPKTIDKVIYERLSNNYFDLNGELIE